MNVVHTKLAARSLPLLNTFRRLESTVPLVCYSTKAKASPATNVPNKTAGATERKSIVPPNFRFVYQEFLPDPKVEWRNPVRERLEREDMLNRRENVDIPEFYVGSILAVTYSDPHADGKTSRFVGLCIMREKCGLRARFIVRNVIDHQGIEISFDLYDPTLQKIEVLRLEKRLDDNLLYLRDALPEYCTVDVNMDPEILPDGMAVPVNDVKVMLKPRPWYARWERYNLQGVANIDEQLNDRRRRSAAAAATPWEKYDLMKEYRRTIPEEEQKEIFTEIYSQLHALDLARKKIKRKRAFVKPTKLA